MKTNEIKVLCRNSRTKVMGNQTGRALKISQAKAKLKYDTD
jgi:hypothetical protein